MHIDKIFDKTYFIYVHLLVCYIFNAQIWNIKNAHRFECRTFKNVEQEMFRFLGIPLMW
jgi:hypothetical protein